MLSRRVWALVVVAAMVVLVALYGGYRFHTYWTQERMVALDRVSVSLPSIGGQRAYIAAEHMTGPRTLVLFMHGYGADHRVLTLPRAHDFAQKLADDGYVLAASDAHNAAWGGAPTQADYVALYRRVAARFDVTRVVVVSESMGAIAAAHLIAEKAIPHLVGWYSVSPVLDLAAAASKPPLQAAIEKDLAPGAVGRLDPNTIKPALIDVPRVAYLGRDDNVVFGRDARPAAARLGIAVRSCSGKHVSKDCYRAGAVTRLIR